MPGVTVQRAPSTAAAAKALLLPENRTASAICSKLCVDLFPGLEVLLEGIEDRSPSGKLARESSPPNYSSFCADWLGEDNYTRFYVLATALDIPVPWTSPALTQRYGLLRMSIPRPDKPPPPSWTGPSVTDRIVAIALPMNRIDRRPSPDVDGNIDMYFVEVRDNRDDGATWAGRLEQAVERVKALGGDAVVLGFWEAY
jgi:prephenate dehydratase